MIVNDWASEWEETVEARRGVAELEAMLKRHADFGAYCAEREQEAEAWGVGGQQPKAKTKRLRPKGLGV